MKFEELFLLSIKAIWNNKLRSFLTTLGITIGVFSIIVLVSIGSGLQTYITGQISALGSNIIDVIPGSQGNLFGGLLSNTLKLEDAKAINRAIDGLGHSTPILQQASILKYKNIKNKSAFVGGVSYQYPMVITNLKMNQGIFFTKGQEQSGANVAVIGSKVYDLFFKTGDAIGKKIFVADKQYIIVGVAKKTGTSIGSLDRDNIVYIPVELAQSQFGTTIVREIVANTDKKEFVPIESRGRTNSSESLTAVDSTSPNSW